MDEKRRLLADNIEDREALRRRAKQAWGEIIASVQVGSDEGLAELDVDRLHNLVDELIELKRKMRAALDEKRTLAARV